MTSGELCGEGGGGIDEMGAWNNMMGGYGKGGGWFCPYTTPTTSTVAMVPRMVTTVDGLPTDSRFWPNVDPPESSASVTLWV